MLPCAYWHTQSCPVHWLALFTQPMPSGALFIFQRISKGESHLLSTSVLTLGVGVVVILTVIYMDTSYYTFKFGAICAYYRSHLFYYTMILIPVWLSPFENSNTRLTKVLGGHSNKESRGTLTCLYTWGQYGRHGTIPLLNFLAIYIHISVPMYWLIISSTVPTPSCTYYILYIIYHSIFFWYSKINKYCNHVVDISMFIFHD